MRHNESVNMEKFWAGFQHCAAEVAQFLNKYDQQIGGELIQHISSYVPNIRPTASAAVPSTPAALNTPRLLAAAAANFAAPRLAMSRDLTAYNQRIFNKMPITVSKSKESLPQNLSEGDKFMKKEFMEESLSVWRPW